MKTYVGGIDWLTGYEIVPLTDEQRMQRKQHLHALPATLDELFERFLLPAIECDVHSRITTSGARHGVPSGHITNKIIVVKRF